MSNVKLVVATIVYESEIAGPFYAHRLFVITGNENFAARFAEFRGELEIDDFRVVHATVTTVDIVDGFAIELRKIDE